MAEKAQFDDSYEQKARQANVMAAQQRYMMEYRGEWQATRLAAVNGLLYGGGFGALLGVGAAISSRRMYQIPRYAALFGVPYSAFLSISTLYRMDM